MMSIYNDSIISDLDCLDLPSGCNGCDCAMEATEEYFEGTANCTWIECSNQNGEITVRCDNHS